MRRNAKKPENSSKKEDYPKNNPSKNDDFLQKNINSTQKENKMNASVLIAAIALPFSALSALSGYLGFRAAEKQRAIRENRDSGTIRTEIKHIITATEKISDSQTEILKAMTLISERVARLEEAQKHTGERLRSLSAEIQPRIRPK